jgi:hypothetical protein
MTWCFYPTSFTRSVLKHPFVDTGSCYDPVYTCGTVCVHVRKPCPEPAFTRYAHIIPAGGMPSSSYGHAKQCRMNSSKIYMQLYATRWPCGKAVLIMNFESLLLGNMCSHTVLQLNSIPLENMQAYRHILVLFFFLLDKLLRYIFLSPRVKWHRHLPIFA